MVKSTYLSKKYLIRCSHQLLDCNNKTLKTKETSFHGHHMNIIITVKGPVDQDSGLIINRDLFDQTVKSKVIDKYDKSNLNDFLKLPTGEMLVEQITIELLDSDISPYLHQVQIKETEKNFFSGPICNE